MYQYKKNVSVRSKSKTNEPRVDKFGTRDTDADASSSSLLSLSLSLIISATSTQYRQCTI